MDEGDVVVRHAHAAPPASRHGLDEDGVAHLMRDSKGLFLVEDGAIASANDGNAGGDGGASRFGLVAHAPDGVDVRPDELDVVGATHFREVGVLCEKAIPGVNRVDVGDFRRGDDARDGEIGARTRARADADGSSASPR